MTFGSSILPVGYLAQLQYRFALTTSSLGILAQSITFGEEESIIATLSPGSYNLSIKYFGANNPQFCETFFLMISIAPLSLTPQNLCSGSAQLASVCKIIIIEVLLSTILLISCSIRPRICNNTSRRHRLSAYRFPPILTCTPGLTIIERYLH